MPKSKLQNVLFTIVMAFVMVYALVCYNIALDKGGMSNEIFLIAFHEIVIMLPVAFVLEFFIVEKFATKLAFRIVTPHRCYRNTYNKVTCCNKCTILGLTNNSCISRLNK